MYVYIVVYVLYLYGRCGAATYGYDVVCKMAAVNGLELLHHTVARDLTSKEDAFVCGLHWCMLINGYKCVGTSSEVVKNVDQVPSSELLPAEWNQNQNLFTLQYVFADASRLTGVILLNIIRVNENLLVNAFNSDTEKTASFTVNPADHIGDDFANFSSAYINASGLLTSFQKEILSQLYPPPPQANRTSTAERPERSSTGNPSRLVDHDPLGVGPPRFPQQGPDWGRYNDPLRVGHSDLDPLGRFGSGMLMDPRHTFPGGRPGFNPSAGIPGQLPRGAVPPGARFDPFAPPDQDHLPHGNRPGPDPDHMKPPGFDDMFS